MQLAIGLPDNFVLEEVNSQYVVPSLKVYFSDKMALFYQPIIQRGDQIFDDEGDNGPATQPEGIYYRIVNDPSDGRYCIQYYIYWLKQNCTGFLHVSNRQYDYEPIFIFIKPPNPIPFAIVNAGNNRSLGLHFCRFHKTEVRTNYYSDRDQVEAPVAFKTSPSPYYPFGGQSGVMGENCVKKYPLPGAIYFEGYKPLFAIDTCFHAFSGAEGALKGKRFDITLKKLEDKILSEWFWEHHKSPDEEPFGHDVSNPFEFPFIKYADPKPFLRK